MATVVIYDINKGSNKPLVKRTKLSVDLDTDAILKLLQSGTTVEQYLADIKLAKFQTDSNQG
jgi:hypothetical protein